MGAVPLEEPVFLGEVETIIGRAAERGIPLRAIGSVGVYLRVRSDPGARAIYLHRHGVTHGGPHFKDLDLAGLERFSSGVYTLFVRELHFAEDRETNALFGMYRNIYFHPHFTIDVFYDTLRFSHEIPLKGRFPPGLTLAPEDLFLGKAQIHDVTPPDLADLASLLSAVPLGRMDRGYLGGRLADDWGLWYDVRANLERARHRLKEWPPNEHGLSEGVLANGRARLQEAVEFLDQLPKTRRWEKRARRGTAEPWFEEVDEVR